MSKDLLIADAVAVLASTPVVPGLGLGQYVGSAAYKFCNGDLSAKTVGISARLQSALAIAELAKLSWEDFGL